MDAPHRNPRAALTAAGELDRVELEDRAPGASFFALVAHLERALGGARLGGDGRAEDERLRLRHDPSLAFQAGEVASVGVDAHGRTTIETTFLGLSGAVGPLPVFLREEVACEDPDRGVRRDLLDVFHHRALSLLYRGVQSRRPLATIARDHGDAWSARMLALASLEHASLTRAERLCVLPLLATGRRSALRCLAAWRVLFRRRLGTGAPRLALRELAGTRTPLPEPARMRLGRTAHALGRDAVVGARALDVASTVVLEVHDVDPQDEVRYRAGGDLHALVLGVFELFDPDATALDLELHLRRRPAFALGKGAALGRATRIGARASSSSVRFATRAAPTR